VKASLSTSKGRNRLPLLGSVAVAASLSVLASRSTRTGSNFLAPTSSNANTLPTQIDAGVVNFQDSPPSASTSTWYSSGISTTAFAASAIASAMGVAAAARGQRRSHRSARTAALKRRLAVAQSATEAADAWMPRMEGWTDEQLEAERQRAKSFGSPETAYTGPRYKGPSSVDETFLKGLLESQAAGILLPKEDAYLIVLDVIDLLRKETTMGRVSIPEGKELTVVGDLHGQYWDFLNVLKLAGMPSEEAPFIFNGDFVDRGSWSIEVILSIFALKLKYPNAVFLNRGNHEMIEANILYGFCGECGAKYDMGLFDLFSEAFRNLPLCHLVEDRVLVLHGGLPGPDPRIWMPGQTHDPTDAIPLMALPSLDQLRDVDRYTEITPTDYSDSIGPTSEDKYVRDQRILIDLLWSDPRGGDGYGPSYRKGKGVYTFGPDVTDAFCKNNNLQCVVRSHEVKAGGYQWDHPKLVSVFSAPNYLDTGRNKGAYLKMRRPTKDGDVEITGHAYTAVKHPDLPSMHWQEHIHANYPHLLQRMRKKNVQNHDAFGDSDFGGFMNIDEWEVDEAEAFQEAFKLDAYGREVKGKESA